jgi:hypothetical protein
MLIEDIDGQEDEILQVKQTIEVMKSDLLTVRSR